MSTYTDTFNTDYNQLTSDIDTYEQEEKDYEASVEAYHAQMKKVEQESDPSKAFTMLMYLMGDQGMDQLDAQTALDGGALQIESDITQCNGDIEDLTNQDSSDPQDVVNAAQDMDKMLDLLGGDSDQSQAVNDAIGSTAVGALDSQYAVLRKQIYWSGESNPDYNPVKGKDTYYFDPSGDDGKISNYAQLQTDLQTRGDPQSANEAEKQKTDAFNENTSTTQSTNAASQEEISNDANTEKSIQSFVVDGFHSITDVMSAAVRAVTQG